MRISEMEMRNRLVLAPMAGAISVAGDAKGVAHVGMALTEDHRELAAVVRSMLTGRYADAARAALDAADETLPPFWKDAADLGWLGLHLPEAYGGQGFGVEGRAVGVEGLGRQGAPGPLVPPVVA